MAILREVANVILGIVVMITIILATLSIGTYLNGIEQDPIEASIIHGLLFGSLILGYFLNKPREHSTFITLYNSKWLLMVAVSTNFLVGVYLYSFPAIESIFQFEFEFLGNSYPVGSMSCFAALIISITFSARMIWKCPDCGHRLPFLDDGRYSSIGFNIKRCPHCDVELVGA